MITFIDALFLSFVFEFGVILVICKLQLGPNVRMGKSVLLNRLVIFSYAILLLISAYSSIIGYRTPLWIPIYGIFIGITVLSILFSPATLRRFLPLLLSLPSLVLVTSLMISGPAPLTSDEGRFTGYAFRILGDGKWTPFRYPENTYYQYFHVIPFLKAILSEITNLDMLYMIHPLFILSLTLFVSLTIYLLVKRLLNIEQRLASSDLAALSPILFLTSPPLSIIAFTPQWLSASLALLTILLIIKSLYVKSSKADTILPLLLIPTGVITHFIYSILVLTSLGVLMTVKLHKSTYSWKTTRVVFKLTFLITFVYWTNTIIMDMMIDAGKGTFTRIMEIVTGMLTPFSYGTFSYSSAPLWLTLAWTFLPALASLSIFSTLLNIFKEFKVTPYKLFVVSLGCSGHLLLIVGFIFHVFHHYLYRYLYPAYFFLIPASIDTIGEVLSRRIFNMATIFLLITMVASIGIQDQAFSPDMNRVMPMSDRRSYFTAEIISSVLPSNLRFFADTRVGIGIDALILRDKPELVYMSEFHYPEIFVINLDSIGRQYLAWFDPKVATLIGRGDCAIMFSDGFYRVFLVLNCKENL